MNGSSWQCSGDEDLVDLDLAGTVLLRALALQDVHHELAALARRPVSSYFRVTLLHDIPAFTQSTADVGSGVRRTARRRVHELLLWAQDEVCERPHVDGMSFHMKGRIAHQAAHHFLTLFVLRLLVYVESHKGTAPLRRRPRVPLHTQSYSHRRSNNLLLADLFEQLKATVDKLSFPATLDDGGSQPHATSPGPQEQARQRSVQFASWPEMIRTPRQTASLGPGPSASSFSPHKQAPVQEPARGQLPRRSGTRPVFREGTQEQEYSQQQRRASPPCSPSPQSPSLSPAHLMSSWTPVQPTSPLAWSTSSSASDNSILSTTPLPSPWQQRSHRRRTPMSTAPSHAPAPRSHSTQHPQHSRPRQRKQQQGHTQQQQRWPAHTHQSPPSPSWSSSSSSLSDPEEQQEEAHQQGAQQGEATMEDMPSPRGPRVPQPAAQLLLRYVSHALNPPPPS
ncbi:hypothetical protein PTSG_03235 [Salpingoeca rosetta]|uniref:Uncharacterized protein n=1 Tax=Salpingoeca rosetta (strain ATCC 50818 / BSB-021) TaxID=946362 RepID=F2U4L7_SALR5|nr:uncharacterized protein PTSG_03235 [Salpingoeca rosetta]EGD82583.1 hypothetical protein PTSG_03235 [Salpingoeca rosetta]|eukprot:XP_004995819.1 hypothetical protein PTSG_03235 [Salpingoeca rosetta]